MNALAIPLPVAVRRRGEIIAIFAGTACFPLALYAGSLESILPRGPAALVLPIVMLSALVGAIASATSDPGKAPEVGGVALRVGARAGFTISLVAGAFTVLASTFHSFGIGAPATVEAGWGLFTAFLPLSPAARVIVLTLLAIPPSIFFGLTGALIAGMLKGDAPASGDAGQSQPPARRERSAAFTVAVVLAVACYLSPLAVYLKPPPAVVVAPPAPRITIPAPPPPPPKWRYEKPAGFENAVAANIAIAARRDLGEVASQLPVAISPDGLRFAFCHSGQPARILVTDLETLDVIASVSAPETPATFAWSPDSKMLLIAGEGENRRLQVFDVATTRLLSLPQPRDKRVPGGQPRWWNAEEVIFGGQAAPAALLSLDNLRVTPLEDAPSWKALTEEQRGRERSKVVAQLPRNEHWQMQIETAVRHYEVPVDSSTEWKAAETLHLAFVDAQNATRQLIMPAEIKSGDILVAASDGTKFVIVRDDRAMIFYFGFRVAPSNSFTVAMPDAPEEVLAAKLDKKSVAGFVCAPLINPLNQKTVGPDRTRVKALARLASWQDKAAEVWIEEEYQPIKPGDVLADLHTWEEHKPQPAGEIGKAEWFGVIDQLETKNAPVLIEAPALDRPVLLIMTDMGGAQRFNAAQFARIHVAAPRSSPPSLPTNSTNTNTDEIERVLGVFVQQHHLKSSRSDVDGLIADYGDRVDYFDKGTVDHNFIRKDELEYHSPGTRITENLLTRVTVREVGHNLYSTAYSIGYQRTRPDGRWMKGVTAVELHIEMTASGPRIVRQRSENREQQKGP